VALTSTEQFQANFQQALRHHGCAPLRRDRIDTLQINVGKRCNQACHHCHVDAGPARREMMTIETAARVIELISINPALRNIDITGGAPELNPNFRAIVEAAHRLEREVIVRCNLTIFFEPGMEWLPDFYQANQVHLVCSLPCYTAENVTKQRGPGVFQKSINALRLLNRLGFGVGVAPLDLVYNPVGPSLPPPQDELEIRYHDELAALDVRFDHLLTITNMPIQRFAGQLARCGRYNEYMGLLVNHFNPATIENLMCRSLVSVGYNGHLYDCDFNQMLEMPIGASGEVELTIWQIHDLSDLEGTPIATASHCFGCTAGAGSSCGGALDRI
jgi:radical SAM/Cys-rich protein